MYIESNQSAYVRDCRLNSSKVVNSEVSIQECYKCYRFDDPGPSINSFKSTSHFKETYLMDERSTNRNLVDLSSYYEYGGTALIMNNEENCNNYTALELVIERDDRRPNLLPKYLRNQNQVNICSANI
ncbi:hypothetical protein PIROE2DRAFT_19061 [Piromyces sp. E2]|nr:hypothetical protein PIROE2DRAFT_19061 [Piromyces sp. E2]|eukprot:OUM56357.1 hypothetical protein PIROE2DRAFT_19061 [Piromyces sp. E2]